MFTFPSSPEAGMSSAFTGFGFCRPDPALLKATLNRIEAIADLALLKQNLESMLIISTNLFGDHKYARKRLHKEFLKRFKRDYKTGNMHREYYFFVKYYLNCWYKNPYVAIENTINLWFG